MPKIIQLDRHVADLIAAGEVVERPASCAKELVENAIDAGARHITVEVQNGGMQLLRVTDDGCGMLPEDARTAFLRHATSKLRTKEDLAAIGTLGFRGEALAAISAVSRIDLLTRAKEADEGVQLHLEAGKVLSERPAGCPQGTTILVRDLFYNTPARMKFMKSDAAEAAAVAAAVQQQALSHPEISFRLLKDGAEQLVTDGSGDRMSAIYVIFGRELAGGMLAVSGRWEKIRVEGFAAKPTATRGNRSYQQFFVNGRFVKSRLLSAAVEQAYQNQIMTGRFPACVLELTLPLGSVDVNVHPAKTEVKFLSEREVFDAVHYAVLSALSRAQGRPEVKLPQPQPPAKPAPAQTPPQSRQAPPAKPDFYRSMQASAYRQLAGFTQREGAPKPETHALASGVQLPRPERELQQTPAAPETPPPPVQAALPPEEKAPAAPAQPEAEMEQQSFSVPETPFRVIGEALDTYILVEQEDAILLIDKHAAHERIRFEALRARQTPVMPQVLLSPVSAQLSREEAACALEHAQTLRECGFEIEDFGDGDVLLRQIPADLTPEDAQALVQALAGALLAGRTLAPDQLRDRLLHTMACKSAIKGGWHTTPAEREALVKQVLSRDDIKYCPHGRPVCIRLTRAQLEKQFQRT